MNVIHAFATRGWTIPALRSFLLALAIGVLLGRLGPFGTFQDLTWPERYGYWIVLTLLMWAQTALLLHAMRTLPNFARRSLLAQVVIVGLIAAVPTTFEVTWAEMLLRFNRDLGPADWLIFYGDVALVTISVALVLELVGGHALLPAVSLSAPGADESSPKTDINDRLPPDRRGRVLAVAAEDHYLRVYTARGEAMILMRMADALRELQDTDGVRVHRSWWVATEAVSSAERDGDRIVLRLENGLSVPVSRTYLMAARDAGLVPRT